MPNNDLKSGLPSADGSPFKTKNFSKFFFGIMIAALILVAIFFAFFYHAGEKHAPSAPGRSSVLRSSGLNC